ncbi:hypothetical protein QL285_064740 [Trifolium repens]|nr:hypothetical protein QL285_064740 [Trifolium repens]
MNSPPYHYYHGYIHNPTTINTHTLLKQQAYQQPTYINTHISQTQPHPDFTTSPSHLHDDLRSSIQQLLHSQQNCLQTMSTCINTLSSLNAHLSSFNHFSTNTSSFTPQNLTYSHSTTPLPPFLYQQPLTPSNISPPNFPCQQPIITPTIYVTTHNFQHCQAPFPSPEPTTLTQTPLPPYNSNHVTTEIDAAKHLIPDLQIHSDLVSHLVGEQHVFVTKDFNDEAPLNLVLDSTTTFSTETATQSKDETKKSSPISKTAVAIEIVGEPIFSISETDEHVTTEKDQVALRSNSFLKPHDPPLRDFDRFASFTTQSFCNISLSFFPAKHRSITTTRPSLLSYRFTVMTRNDGRTLFGETKQQVLNHELSVNNFERSFDFPVVCTFNFDPGGDEFSPIANSGGHLIFSLLWLPWDRGKKSRKWMRIVLVPTTSPCLFSGIWYFGQFGICKRTAMYVKEKEAVMVNGKLKSIKFSIDLMGLYVDLLHFDTGPKLLRRNRLLSKKFGNYAS